MLLKGDLWSEVLRVCTGKVVMTHLTVMACLTFIILSDINVSAIEKEVFIHEDFEQLENWKPLFFKNIEEHTSYSIEKKGNGSYLKAESNASASGIIFEKNFNVFEYPKVKWRWKVSNIFTKGDASKKSGDDYPIRIYVIFLYDPEKASFGRKFKYGLAKGIYGEYPPDSSLNYIWANRAHPLDIITNRYAAEAKMIVLQAGDENAGKWAEQDVDIISDYRRAFGKEPPETASLAIMSDSDNTGETAVSYIDYIEVYR